MGIIQEWKWKLTRILSYEEKELTNSQALSLDWVRKTSRQVVVVDSFKTVAHNS